MDKYTFEIDLVVPPWLFLKMAPMPVLAAVPKGAVESGGAGWTDPGRIVTSGAFQLVSRVAHEGIVLRRNPRYYEAGLFAGGGGVFDDSGWSGDRKSVPGGGGACDAGRTAEPGTETPVLRRHRDYHLQSSFFSIWHGFNVRKPPFDDVRLRDALNMATDKASLAKVFGSEGTGARTIVPPYAGYEPVQTLPVEVYGETYDVLAYDVEGARRLLSSAGYPNGRRADGTVFAFEVEFPALPHSKPIVEILEEQWRRNLQVTPKLVPVDFNSWSSDLLSLGNRALAEGGGAREYYDPAAFLDWFARGSVESGTGYTDAEFDRLFEEANLTEDSRGRLNKLAAVERRLMKAMPCIPVVHNLWRYLQKPYVRGLEGNALDKHPFKYVWIDTGWSAGR